MQVCRLRCSSVVRPDNEIKTECLFASHHGEIQHLQITHTQGLLFDEMDINSMLIVAISDDSFTNTLGLTSQFGYAISLEDDEWNVNNVHCGSSRCHRIPSSVKETEIHAMI